MCKQSPVSLFVTAAATLAACQRQSPPATTEPVAIEVPVALQPVRVQPLQRTVRVVGTLHGDEEVVLAAKVPGRVAAVAHDVGDTVQAGEVLARLEDEDYELAVRQREAALQAALAELGLTALPDGELDVEAVPAVARVRVEAKNAEARWRRGEAMFAEKPPLITDEERADLDTAMQSARAAHAAAVAEARAKAALAAVRAAELAQSRKALADTALVAPPGGPWHVGRRRIGVGDYVTEAAAMFDLVDTDPIEFRADVPERWSAAVRAGAKVTVEVAALREPLTGTVTRLSPMADARNRTFEVEIELPNADGRLLPGGFARGEIATHVDPAVVFVPQDAVVVALGLSKVFTVEGGKAVEHKVTTGVHDGTWLEVAQGDLGPADQVVVSGAARLATGVAVAVARPAGGSK